MKSTLVLSLLAALLGGCAIGPPGYGYYRGGYDQDRSYNRSDGYNRDRGYYRDRDYDRRDGNYGDYNYRGERGN